MKQIIEWVQNVWNAAPGEISTPQLSSSRGVLRAALKMNASKLLIQEIFFTQHTLTVLVSRGNLVFQNN